MRYCHNNSNKLDKFTCAYLVVTNRNMSQINITLSAWNKERVTEVLFRPLAICVVPPSSTTKQQQTLQPRFTRLIKGLSATPWSAIIKSLTKSFSFAKTPSQGGVMLEVRSQVEDAELHFP
jgi:hypothetical protein